MDAICAGMNAAFIHSSLLLHSFISEPYAPTCRRCLYAASRSCTAMLICIDAQETFAKEGLKYSMEGQTGNTLNSHRLIALAGQQGLDKQDKVVEALFRAYFTEVLVCFCSPVNKALTSANKAIISAKGCSAVMVITTTITDVQSISWHR